MSERETEMYFLAERQKTPKDFLLSNLGHDKLKSTGFLEKEGFSAREIIYGNIIRLFKGEALSVLDKNIAVEPTSIENIEVKINGKSGFLLEERDGKMDVSEKSKDEIKNQIEEVVDKLRASVHSKIDLLKNDQGDYKSEYFSNSMSDYIEILEASNTLDELAKAFSEDQSEGRKEEIDYSLWEIKREIINLLNNSPLPLTIMTDDAEGLKIIIDEEKNALSNISDEDWQAEIKMLDEIEKSFQQYPELTKSDDLTFLEIIDNADRSLDEETGKLAA